MAEVAPATETGRLAKEPSRVLVFTGPKEGVGKSTLCLNLALAWAGSQNRKVIIVHMDPLCRNDLSYLLGVNPPTLASMAQLVGDNPTGLGKLLKGRIPMTQWGVGLLPLAAKRSEILSLSPQLVVQILGSLAEAYDLFLDVDPFFPMQIFSFDLADLIFWTCLPQRAHFEATYNMFQEIKALHFPLEKFEVVVNAANLPGALAPKEVDRFFSAMQKKVLAYMPWEDLLPEYANTQKILVVENLQSEWVKTLRIILGRTMELKATPKSWESYMAAEEFSEGADFLWKPQGRGGGGTGRQERAAAPTKSAASAPAPGRPGVLGRAQGQDAQAGRGRHGDRAHPHLGRPGAERGEPQEGLLHHREPPAAGGQPAALPRAARAVRRRAGRRDPGPGAPAGPHARPDRQRDHGQLLRPHLHRAGRQAGAAAQPLPQRRAGHPGHQAHRGSHRPAHRRVRAAGGRPPQGRLARQRHHRAAGRLRARA